MPSTTSFSINCKHCGKAIRFDQPYVYHAGFSDQGFLYNDAGTCTLVWSLLDPVLDELFPGQAAWMLSPVNRRRFERLLLPAPDGGRWRFRNPARCIHCAKPVLEPMLRTVQYLVYPGSIITDQGSQLRLRELVRIGPHAKLAPTSKR